MNLIAGYEFVFLLIIIGYINYLFMLKRYRNDIKKRKINQYNKIAKLYPKGTIIST
tara:strand:+ start:2045 stop:2212 length:168 start_codon:yes stop_codon:yes gene_type:complete